MRVLAVIFVAFVLIAANVLAEENADCHDEHLDVTVKRGEIAYPKGECLRLTCPESGPLRVEPCEFAIGPGCRVVDGDLSKQFPACCSTVVCD